MKREFTAGFAAAVAELVRLHGEPSMAADVLAGAGYSLANLEEAKIDPYDFEVLKVLYAEEHVLRRPKEAAE